MKRLAPALLILGACHQPAPDPASVQEASLDRRLLEIASEYPEYGIVDTKFSWVMILCRRFDPPARVSASEDAGTHGNKLYLLYAKDWDAYVKGIDGEQPVGQVIVKEAWDSRVSDKPGEGAGFSDIDDQTSQPESRPVRADPAVRDGKYHYPTQRHALFIMVKAGDGWKYGTVSGDGKRVYQSGLIRSCAGCHQGARPDSLFGLPGHPQDR